MFKSLKQKIAKENGVLENEIFQQQSRHSSLRSSSLGSSKDEISAIAEEKDEELINFLRNELTIAQNKVKILEQEKLSLEESLRLSHMHKDLMREEADKIQDILNQEIAKLKNLLLFREQESLDQLNRSKHEEIQMESLKGEISRIKNLEPMFEKLKAYQESELSQTREKLSKYNETNEDVGANILALQRENNEAIEKLKLTEGRLIEFSKRICELEEETLMIDTLKAQVEQLDEEVADKNKAIKILNQRLFDVKKSLNEEIKNNNGGSTGTMTSSQPAILIPVNVDNNINPFNGKKSSNIPASIVLDDVKFSYLKHVVLKFLTTESKHLIKPVSTLLYLTESEEKLLEEVLEYRKSWFKSKPSY